MACSRMSLSGEGVYKQENPGLSPWLKTCVLFRLDDVNIFFLPLGSELHGTASTVINSQ